jgi:hypothetical protein
MSARRAVPLLIAMAAALSAGAIDSASAQAGGQAGWVLPRTPDGHPDLQGNWGSATITPLERPEGQGPVLSWDQVVELEGRAVSALERSVESISPERGQVGTGATGGYDGFYMDRGDRVAMVDGEPRSSLIVSPANGRVPALSPEGQRWRADQARFRRSFGEYDHPELRPLGERCMMSFGSSAGPPMVPNTFYNNNYTITQTADHVVIMAEMVHDARIIRLGEGPRLPDHVRPWMGDSWGRWEGETLVVETRNVHPFQRWRGNPTENLRVTERFTRVDEHTLLYEFTVEDPSVYSEPWSAQIPWNSMDDLLYEYACHEGNYALDNILRGWRFQEERDQAGGQ